MTLFFCRICQGERDSAHGSCTGCGTEMSRCKANAPPRAKTLEGKCNQCHSRNIEVTGGGSGLMCSTCGSHNVTRS